MILRPEPLTEVGFRPYGTLISLNAGVATAANQGSALRSDNLTTFTGDRPHARLNVSVYRSEPRTFPFPIALLERHPHSTQLFAPLGDAVYMVVVAPSLPNGSPNWQAIQAFKAQSPQAINYHQGTWHHPLIVASASPIEFMMIAWEDGSPNDCEESSAPAATVLQLER